MRPYYYLFLTLLTVTQTQALTAQQLNLTDVTLFSGAVQESPHRLITDAEANVYLAVSHYQDFRFDPGQPALPGGNGRSAAVVKRRADGATEWVYGARYAGAQDCSGINCFGQLNLLTLIPDGGGLYAGGDFNAPTDLDNGPEEMLVGDESVIIRLEADGDFAAAYRFSSADTPGDVELNGLVTDQEGNVYFTGTYRTAMTINTGTASADLPGPGEETSIYNGFIGRISPEGNIDWVYSLPFRLLSGITDGLKYRDGELHWAGSVRSRVDFDPTAVVLRTQLRSNSGNFIVRYTTEGEALSLFTFADIEGSGGMIDFELGEDGNYYGIGVTGDSINLTGNGSSPLFRGDGWMASWKQNGNLRWQQDLPAFRLGEMDVDAAGIVYLTNNLVETLEVPGPAGPVTLTPPPGGAITYLQPYSREGALADPVSLISSSQTSGTVVRVSDDGNLHWSGTFRGELTEPGGRIIASDDIDVFLLTLTGAVPVPTRNPAFEVPPTLFPNPARDRVLLTLDQVYAQSRVSVFSVDGREWLTRYITGARQLELPVNTLSKGYYFARIVAGERVASVPFVVE